MYLDESTGAPEVPLSMTLLVYVPRHIFIVGKVQFDPDRSNRLSQWSEGQDCFDLQAAAFCTIENTKFLFVLCGHEPAFATVVLDRGP